MTDPQHPTPDHPASQPEWQTILLSLLSPLRWLWSIARLFYSVLAPTRVALLLIAAALLLLVYHEQGKDLAIALVEDSGNILRWTLFLIATLWWSVQSWLWSRIALDHRFGPRENLDPKSEKLAQAIGSDRTHSAVFLIEWVPRLYAFLVFILAVVAIYNAGGSGTVAFWLFLALGAAVLAALWQRRKIFERRKSQADSKPGLARRLAKIDPARSDAIMGRSGGARILAWTAFGLAIAMTALVAFDAVGVGAFLGAPSISFLAFASMLVVLGIPAGLSVRYGFPFITTLLILVGVLGGLLPDAHTIPMVTANLAENTGTPDKDAKPGEYTVRRSLEGTWEAWHGLSRTEAPRPITFIATAGGGVRAALWTSIVLDRAGFATANRNHLFAISGVSGGALGATLYQAWLGAGEPSPAESCPTRERHDEVDGAGAFRRVAACALTFDQLGPTFAAALYGDLLYTFLPIPFLPDSALALTEAWERGWRRAVACPGGGSSCDAAKAFERNFLSTWNTKGWMPALMLNGTHVQTGKRIITSDVRLRTTTIEDAWDFHAVTRRDVATSMAALNASRFPGLVGGGAMTHDGKRWGHIVDGGYFENSGGQTLGELARDVLAKAAKQDVKVRPIFIEIVSDPDLESHDHKRLCVPPRIGCVGTKPDTMYETDPKARSTADTKVEIEPNTMDAAISSFESSRPFLIGVTGPVTALTSTRSSRGVVTPKLLARQAREFKDAVFVQFRLCPPGVGEAKAPLGWLLSKKSAKNIADSLPTAKPTLSSPPSTHETCRADNWAALKALEKAVAGEKLN